MLVFELSAWYKGRFLHQVFCTWISQNTVCELILLNRRNELLCFRFHLLLKTALWETDRGGNGINQFHTLWTPDPETGALCSKCFFNLYWTSSEGLLTTCWLKKQFCYTFYSLFCCEHVLGVQFSIVINQCFPIFFG